MAYFARLAITTIAVCAIAPIKQSNAGFCGPQSKIVKEFLIPEYTCFDLKGGTIPSAACAAVPSPDYKPVYFGTACQQHDRCYGTKGTSKSKCDEAFRDLLIATCDQTLTNKFRVLSRRACHKLARSYFKAVRKFGDEPFEQAQLAGRFIGEWRGIMRQPGFPNFDVTIEINGFRENAVCGKITHSDLSCSGNLRCLSLEGNLLLAQQKMTYGKDRCLGGLNKLTIDFNENLTRIWIRQSTGKEGARGTLHRKSRLMKE